ncbi:energy transducer TonB, partial [Flavobacteriaceae bacterium]|nr:energy transducer TonB [Flavobacteriaceae bacterium]
EPIETPPEKVVPKVSEATKSVVSNLLKNKTQEGDQVAGEGDDSVQGDKGKIDGNPYASSYYNTAGLGGRGKGFGLNGRNLQTNGKVIQECNQEGTVVVRITVNNQGNVIAAEPGVKGSTNTHPCLLQPAKKTALLHKWYPDNNAPSEQIGFVVIQFKLGE